MRVRLNDLAPGVNYVLRLRSTDGEHVSEWSRSFDLLTTSDTVAPKTPTGVTATMTGTSFNLSWTPVILSADDTPARDLDHYDILVESSGTATNKVYSTADSKFQFTFEMNRELFGTPRANVIMSVRAVDKTGNASAYSATASQTNPAPSNPTGFAGASQPDSIYLKWNAVTDSDLLMYRVYSGTTSGSQTTLEWSGTATSTVINSIAYFTDKWFKVVAVDVFGTESSTPPVVGPFRPASPFSTDTTAPATPTGLSATLSTTSNASNTRATVSWTAVTDTDGDLAGYKISYRPVGATDWSYADVDYTKTSTIIDRLIPYVNYEFQIRSYDFSANYSAASSTVTATGATNVAPATPAAPSAASATMRVQVTQPTTNSVGGAMDADVVFYEVYASTTSGFTPSSTNMLGTIPVGPAQVATFQIPASGSGTTETWYVKTIAVDAGGLKSAASAQATATPNLILTANIGDLQVTNAKINSLNVDKLTAGSGFVNDLTVKSKFTLGDATTDGIIEDYTYGTSGGTTGFRMAKSGLIIKSGLIEAAALRLQNSPNLMPPQYADFENLGNYYVDPFWSAGGQSGMASVNAIAQTYDSTPASLFKGSRFLSIAMPFNTNAMSAYFAKSSTDYNISVEAGKTYIFSVYMRNIAANTETWNINVKGDTGASISSTPFALPASEAALVRRSFAVTIPAGVKKVLIWIEKPGTTNSGLIHIDCAQFEEKTGADNTPSVWKPPGATTLDGSGIITGYIKSNTNIEVAGTQMPSWSLNKEGNIQVGDALIRGKLIVGTVSESPVNRAPNNGDFETNVTGYTVFTNGGTSTAIARTTTVGEVITGTGSAKITAAAGSKVELGAYAQSAIQINAGATITVLGKAKVNTTDAGSYIAVSYFSGVGGTRYFTDYQIANPTSGQVYDFTSSYNVGVGESVTHITISHINPTGSITSTSVILDDIVINEDQTIGVSYVTSPNYVAGADGWRISGDGNVEFNSGTFRGVLGANVVTADSMSSDMIIATNFRTGITGRRAEFSPNGIVLYDTDNTILVNMATDSDQPVTISADLLASSLTISDQMAIRGSNNELARNAELTIQSGSTAPVSPPTVQIGWDQINVGTDTVYAPYRYGLAYSSVLNRFMEIQSVYGSNANLTFYNPTTGAQDFFTTPLNHIRDWGDVMVWGGEIYIVGKNIDGDWRIEVRNETTKAWVRTLSITNSFNYRVGIGNDGTNIFLLYGANSDHRIYVQKYNKTTGALVSTTASGVVMSGGNYHISGAGYVPSGTAGGFSATRYWYTRDNLKTVYAIDATLQPLPSASEDFVSPNNIRGATFADIGTGACFWTWDYASGSITKHTEATWVGNNAASYRWHACNTWYDNNATGGTHETLMGPVATFSMVKRAGVTITSPPIPARPIPNTNDDAVAAGVYLAKNASILTQSNRLLFERQMYMATGVRTASFYRNGGGAVTTPTAGTNATVPPPATNGFSGLATAPGKIRSANDLFNLYGDGTGKWADATFSATAVTIPNRLMTRYVTGSFSQASIASGGTAVNNISFSGFSSPPTVFAVSENARITVSVNNITTTGATIGFGNWSPGAPGTFVVRWFAFV